MNRHLGSVFVSLVFVITSSTSAIADPTRPVGKPAAAQGCQPKETPKDDALTCTGPDTDGVAAGRGDDLVVIESDAFVSTTASDPRPQSTAVDGQADNDTIINHGLIHATVLSIGSHLKNIQALGTDKDVAANRAVEDKKLAQASGIAGGDGADSIENTGTVLVNTITDTSPGASSDGPQGPGARTRSSQALSLSTGIDGGAGHDAIVNRGNITVTATSIADKADFSEGNTAPGNSSDNKDVNARATAVGIHGGDGDDTITNTGSIAVIATSTTLRSSFGGSNGPANASPQTRSGTTVEAVATGIDGGDGNDSIINEQTVSAVATAIAPAIGVALPLQGGQNADATVTAISESTGIDGGNGDDNIVNRGAVTSVATSAVFAVSGSITKQGNSSVSNAGSDSSSSGEASATGIAGGGGNDTINNEGPVAAVATVESLSASGSLAIGGSSAAKGTSTAESSATGIDAGAGNDTVANSRSITATATSLAQGLGIAVSVKESSNPPASVNAQTTDFKAAADASTTAEATAAGVVADSGEATSASNIVFTGLSIAYSTSKQAASGDDGIANSEAVTAVATALSTATGGALTVEGEAAAKATSTAKTTATGIDAGGGHDTVSNSGTLGAVATSIATGLSVGVALKSDSGGTETQASQGGSKAAADASVTAEATAAGILGDTGEQSSSTDVGLAVDLSGLRFGYRTSKEAASGADTITNTGAIDVFANAASAAGAGAVTLKGDASAKADSTAKSTATGIDAGAGNDTAANSGSILAEAGSVAAGLSVGVGLESGSDSSSGGSSTLQSILDLFSGPKAAADASVTAEATAAGIFGDSGEQSTGTEVGLRIDSNGLAFAYRTSKEAASGDDTIASNGDIATLANSLSGAGSGEVTFKGNASAKATSTARSTAMGIDAGAGDDTVVTSGSILVEAGSVAAGAAIGVALESGSGGSDGDSPVQPILDLFAGPMAAADTSVTAETTAAGIRGDSGARTSSKETRLGIQIDLASDTGGISYHHAESTAGATGNDTITNSAGVAVLANSLSGAAGGAVTLEGDASAKATSTAKSTATGIDAGAGDDGVTNSGDILVEAGSTAAGLSIAAGVDSGQSGDTGGDNPLQPILDLFGGAKATAEVSVTAEASAAGILGDSGEGTSSQETSLGFEIDLANNTGGISYHHAESTAGATGDDTITNTAGISARANSVSGAVGGAVAIGGDAAAKAASTASSTATGIDAGSGKDTVDSSGSILAEAGSVAAGLSIAVGVDSGQSGGSGGDDPLDPILDLFAGPKAAAEASVTAEATAAGILGDSGAGTTSQETSLGTQVDLNNNAGEIGYHNTEITTAATGDDTITNTGGITVLANSVSGAIGGTVAISGDAAAKAASTATSTAVGIDAGAGDDTVDNSGSILAEAGSAAVGLSIGIGVGSSGTSRSKTTAEVSVTAEATAAGISGDSGQAKTATEVDLALDLERLNFDFSTSKDAASGKDEIVNDRRIDAVAAAVSGAGALAIGIDGKASAKTTSEARSTAMGIDGGGGDDSITNRGAMTATAVSVAGALSAAISTKGAARATGGVWDGGADAEAIAVGIYGDGTGGSSSTEIGISADFEDLSAQFGYAKKEESAAGSDTIRNEGSIVTSAVAETPVLDVAVAASQGMAAAISSASAESRSSAIDAGGGSDQVFNSGDLTSAAVANANAISVSVAGKGTALAGDAVWSGGVTANATAKGIDGDGEGSNKTTEIAASVGTDGVHAAFRRAQDAATGDDAIDNEGDITTTAVAVTPAIAVAIGAQGMAGSVSTSEARSLATAIDGGGGNDTVLTSGALKANADSVATAVNVAISARSGAVAADAIWDGGTTAEATAAGIDADGSAKSSFTETTLTAGGDGFEVEHRASADIAGGNDTIINEATIGATAVAVAPAVSVAVSARGVGIASSTATARADAAAIDGGSGSDDITNHGELAASAVANADAVNVAVTTGSGLGLAGNPVWDGGTTSQAVAKGIDADGAGTSSASETTLSISAGEAVFAHHSSKTSASGHDRITNTHNVDATATAVSAGLTVGVAVSGVSGAISTSTAKSEATAIDAGAGDDEIHSSGELAATATSVAASVNVAITGGSGVAIAADAVFDGGTTAEATAKGIDADGKSTNETTETTITANSDGTTVGHRATVDIAQGQDILVNDGSIDATATAAAPSIGVAVAVTGAGVAASTATAQAEATAIDMGAGNDDVTNRGALDAMAVANADAVNVSVTSTGGAIAGNNVWNGGTISEAAAKGIDTDGTGVSTSAQTALGFSSDGATFLHRTAVDAARGDDTIHNEARIDADAVAVTAGVAVGVTAAGGAAAISTSTAKSHATAIDAGDGSDAIMNTAAGELTATATSTAVAVNAGIAAGTGLAVAADAVWDGGTTAEATAKGIDADGSSTSSAGETTIAIGSAGASIGHSESMASASGDDMLTNDASIRATATAVAPSASIAVAVSGVAVAASTATAQAEATAIDMGAGNDDVTNRGALDAIAVANADAVNVSVTGAGGAVAGNNVFDGGVTAEASAKGIDADGGASSSSAETTLTIDSAGAGFSHRAARVSASGSDTIRNEAKIDADATAVSAGVAVTVPVAGAGLSASTATARSDTRAIDAGSGDDVITNSALGELNASATSVAAAVNVSVTPAGLAAATDAIWNGGTTAEATVKGIDADGSQTSTRSETTLAIDGDGATFSHLTEREPGTGNDTIVNDAKVDAKASAVSVSVGVSVAVAGVAAAASTATTRSDATGIDAGGGNDNVTNRGELDVDAVSNANAVAVSVTPAGVAVTGDAVWDGGTTAQASATGLAGDGSAVAATTETAVSGSIISHRTVTESASGDDSILNEGRIDANAVAVAPALDVPVAVFGVAAAVSNSTARADATAIDAGSGNDEITNRGELTATAVANADTANVAVTVGGVGVAGNSVWDGGTTAEAVAKGIDADGNGARVTNERAIEFGEDGITVTTRSTRASGSGSDVITNDARITASATAVPVAVAVGVAAIGGVGAAVSTSTATSLASAIDAGGGDDDVTNNGELEAVATSTAVTVNGSFALIGAGVSADAVWDGGTTAQATAFGIDADGRGAMVTSERTTTTSASGVDTDSDTTVVVSSGNDLITNTNTIVATAKATAPSIAVGLGGVLGAALATSTAESKATAIDGGDGDDEIGNTGALTATADSTAVAVNVSAGAVALSVNNVWDGGTTAAATAKGIDAGRGEDTVSNAARTESVATATAPAVSVALGGAVGAAVSTATSEARASAIDTGGDDDSLTNSGELIATADADAVAVNVAVTSTGLAVAADAAWDGGTTADARAKGIDGGKGRDGITNTGGIDATADADTTSVGVSAVTMGGVGASISTSTATSRSSAIDGGDDNDTIANFGSLTAAADSRATGVNVSLSLGGASVAADAVWDGGTTADAAAKGIEGGAGDDTIGNAARVDASAVADSSSVGVSATLVGIAGASSTSTATTRATAIDGGEDHDTITNLGQLTSTADSSASAVSVAVTLAGAAAALDAVWDGGTTADAAARGIDGGGGNDAIANHQTVAATSTARTRSTGVSASVAGAAGALSQSTALAGSSAIGGGEGGDTIANHGALTADATADARGTSVSVALVGAAAADASSSAIARATGIDGGQGDDTISNNAPVSAMALATAKGSSVEVAVVGVPVANPLLESGTHADATAVGVTGGAGSDTVENDSTIDLESTARTDASAVSVSLVDFGSGSANVAAEAIARGTGIEGGAGADVLDNRGDITASVTAESPVRGVNVTLAGVASADFGSQATSVAIGMDSGSGDDTINSSGTIALDATSKAPASGKSIGILGVAEQNVHATATALATGIDGGAGSDQVVHSGGLALLAHAEALVSGSSWNLAGVSSQQGLATAISRATGIAAGDGADTVLNTGDVDVDATATLRTQGSSTAVFGGASADASVAGDIIAVGIDGGNDADRLTNAGTVNVTASSSAQATGSSWNLAGSANATAGLSSLSTAVGIDGGAGHDLITSLGALHVDAMASASASSSSWTLAGGASGSGTVTATTRGIGITGGSGADEIRSGAGIDVDAVSTVTASGGATAIFGGANAGASIIAESLATGVDGEDGSDLIENSSGLDVRAVSTMTSSQVAFSFAGGTSAGATLRAGAGATGVSGGGGADQIQNAGLVNVLAISALTATGGADTKIGGASAGATVFAEASATGVDSGSDHDIVTNLGSLTVRAEANPAASSNANAGGLFSDGLTRSISSSTTIARGMNLAEGGNSLVNAGTLSVTTAGAVRASASSDGDTLDTVFGIDLDARASSTARLSATEAVGILAGSGDDVIENTGSMSVAALPQAIASSNADGDAIVDGDGTATATARADNARAIGIQAGGGANTIINRGTMTVGALPRADADSDSDADGVDPLTQPDSRATVTVSANNALAMGIDAGDGDNWILNEGTLTVTAAPRADRAEADAGFGGDFLGIDSFATTTATANGAQAIGIRVGHGDNEIWNTGTIDVESRPRAIADANADGVGFDGDAEARATARADNALAVGIRTGDGNNTVVNDGDIVVTAAPVADAVASASPGTGQITTVIRTGSDVIDTIFGIIEDIAGEIIDVIVDDGERVQNESQTASNARAIGIWTGDGDDVIVNNGSVTTTIGSSAPGIAILAGAGHDAVVLGDGSATTGSILLESGNDTLHLFGTPVVDGAIDSGSGTDALIFDGTGSFSNPLAGFANASKQGAGTYTLPDLATMQRLEIKEGTLQLNSNYTMGSGSTFQTTVNGDGTHGQLKVGGTAGLDGALAVDKGPGVYLDGTTFDVVSADTVSGRFASGTLPAPTALVSFSTNQLPDAFQVEASVEPFASVTSNRVGADVAAALDTILPAATGDMAGVLGSLQQLTRSDFDEIYSGISGESHDHFRASTFNTMQRYSGTIHSRMNLARAAFRGTSTLASADRTRMSQDALLVQYGPVSGVIDLSGNGSAGQPPPRYGMWVSAFGQTAGQHGGDGYSGFNDRTIGRIPFGFDLALDDNLIVGFAVGQSYSHVIRDQAMGGAEGAFGTIYGTYFTRNAQVEAVVSRGWHQYENTRVMDLGNEQRVAFSRHGGDAFAAALEARYSFDFDDVRFEPFSSLHYNRLTEEGFRETGAGSLNLIVNERRTESLTSQLGFRVVRPLSLDSGTLVPEFMAAWKHDFNADGHPITAAFEGAPGAAFELEGSEMGQEALLLGGALVFVGDKDFSASAGFSTELGKNREGLSGLLQVRYEW